MAPTSANYLDRRNRQIVPRHDDVEQTVRPTDHVERASAGQHDKTVYELPYGGQLTVSVILRPVKADLHIADDDDRRRKRSAAVQGVLELPEEHGRRRDRPESINEQDSV